MNETFNFKWDKEPEKDRPENPDIKKYNTPADVRHVTFVLANGEHHTYYYFELRKLVYMPEENKLELTFPIEAVTLQGHNLLPLYEAMRCYVVLEIRVTDERYMATKKDDEVMVTEISILIS